MPPGGAIEGYAGVGFISVASVSHRAAGHGGVTAGPSTSAGTVPRMIDDILLSFSSHFGIRSN